MNEITIVVIAACLLLGMQLLNIYKEVRRFRITFEAIAALWLTEGTLQLKKQKNEGGESNERVQQA